MKYLNVILSGLIIIYSLGATYQKYSKNVFYYAEFKTQNELLEFLSKQPNMIFIQVVTPFPTQPWGLYYGIKIYLEKCVYGCEQ